MFSYKIYYFFLCALFKKKKRGTCATILPQNIIIIINDVDRVVVECEMRAWVWGHVGIGHEAKKDDDVYDERRYFGSTQKSRHRKRTKASPLS